MKYFISNILDIAYLKFKWSPQSDTSSDPQSDEPGKPAETLGDIWASGDDMLDLPPPGPVCDKKTFLYLALELCQDNLRQRLDAMAAGTTTDFKSDQHYIWTVQVLKGVAEGMDYYHREGFHLNNVSCL
jgi:hypothetical protein